ncbi:MAG: glycosyltransferase family 9 protein [Myxococcaceae bacterium]
MRSILLIRYSALGDVVLATSVVAPLRSKYPGVRIEWLTDANFAPLLEGVVDRVISFERRNPVSRAAALLDVKGRFDLAIDLQNKLWSMRAARAAAPERKRFVRRTAWQALVSLVGRDVVLNAEHATSLYASAAGVEAGPLALRVSDEARARAVALLPDGPKPWAAIAPGAAWETKRWPPERFGELGARLQAKGFRVALLGGPMDAPLLEAVKQRCPVEADLTQEKLPALAAALARCKVLVGNDSGLVHVAQAVGCRAVAIFGPTSVKRWGPRSPGTAVSLGLECAPCTNHGGKRCPLGHHDCLQKLSVDQVDDVLPLL